MLPRQCIQVEDNTGMVRKLTLISREKNNWFVSEGPKLSYWPDEYINKGRVVRHTSTRKRKSLSRERATVYLLKMGPREFKVGVTKRDVKDRINDLKTGNYMKPIEIAHKRISTDCAFQAESKVKQEFRKVFTSGLGGTEVFRVTSEAYAKKVFLNTSAPFI